MQPCISHSLKWYQPFISLPPHRTSSLIPSFPLLPCHTLSATRIAIPSTPSLSFPFVPSHAYSTTTTTPTTSSSSSSSSKHSDSSSPSPPYHPLIGYTQNPRTPPPMQFPTLRIPAYKLTLAKWLGLLNKKQVDDRSTYLLYNQCVKASFNYLPHLFPTLPDTFQTWFSLTQLHVWLVLVRLRKEGPEQRYRVQFLVNHFFNDIEKRLWALGFTLQSAVDKHLKECFSMYTGCNLALDAAVFHSDTLLAQTLWKNMFQGLTNVSLLEIETMVNWVRRELHHLQSIPFHEFERGDFLFAHQLNSVNELTPMKETQELKPLKSPKKNKTKQNKTKQKNK